MKKYYNVIAIIAVVVLVVGGLIWLSLYSKKIAGEENRTEIPASNGAFVSEESNFDFGTISMAAGKVSHTFKIINTGAEPLTITKIYTSCMCTEAIFVKDDVRKGPFGMPGHGGNSRLKEILAPNEKADIEVTFDPAAHGPAGIGLTERQVYIESSGGKLMLKIKANVIP